MVRSKPPPRRPPFNKGGSNARNYNNSVMANNTANNSIAVYIIDRTIDGGSLIFSNKCIEMTG